MVELLPHISVRVYALGLAALLVVYIVFARLRTERRIKALGVQAPRVQSLVPFGLKFIAHGVYDTIYHRDLDTWQKWFRPHGPNCKTVAVNILGMPLILTHDYENIQAILATQFEDYEKGPIFHEEWKPFLGDSIFTTDGDSWRASRKLIRPQFIKERVSDLSIFEAHLQVLFECLDDLGNGAEVDINDFFLRFTLDTITEFLMGKSVDSLRNPYNEFSKAMAKVQSVQNMIGKTGPAKVLIPLGPYNAGIDVINKFVYSFVEQALDPSIKTAVTGPHDKYTFLHALAEFTNDRDMLRDQIIAVLIAGRDTTASAISWIFYELSRHPEVVVKLRTEIEKVVGYSQQPTYENLKNMKYLSNVLNEALRLYPGVPFNVRSANKDTTLPRGGGSDGQLPVAVLKDTLVVYSALALHRLPEHFPNPLEFDPDRWDGKPPTPWTYVPFNGGPRMCVGQPFALAEMGYVTVRMLQRYERVQDLMDSTRRDRELRDWNLKSEIVLQPREGTKVGLWRA